MELLLFDLLGKGRRAEMKEQTLEKLNNPCCGEVDRALFLYDKYVGRECLKYTPEKCNQGVCTYYGFLCGISVEDNGRISAEDG